MTTDTSRRAAVAHPRRADRSPREGAASGIARRLARLPGHAALETRRAYDAAARNDLAAQLQYEADRQGELLDRPEFEEGVRAFLEKREPDFGAIGANARPEA